MEPVGHPIVGIVIPCYKVGKSIRKVLENIPSFVNHIIVIDDNCPQHSGKLAEIFLDNRITVIYHPYNKGVGASVISGYKKGVEIGCYILVKIDGDDQMDPQYIKEIIVPLINNNADYVKGNRFKNFKALKNMPKLRLIGNSCLHFLVKIVSGYWNIGDPTNGYTAILASAINKINFQQIDKGYFFEIDMLINLKILNARVIDIAIPARYQNEESSLSIRNIIRSFPLKLINGFFKRLFS